MVNTHTFAPVSVLYVPAHKARAIEKARRLAADMILLDLEDAVPEPEKDNALAGLTDVFRKGFAEKRVAVRINSDARGQRELEALDGAAADFIVVPKVDHADELPDGVACPLLAMIESPTGVLNAPGIAADNRVTGLIAGLNDLAFELALPDADDRSAMALSLQSIVLAARAVGAWCFDGVCNSIDDAARFEAEARDGWRLGFDGKTLIHPSQIDPCNRIWAPDAETLERAHALVEAASGGAERFGGRMIEDMHVDAARRMIERAGLR